MIVLSCFDGMSCGQIALKRAGFKISKYYASEIDPYAIKVTMANYPNTVQLGSITDWKSWNIQQPDLIIAGSPCQGFSFAGKQLNFNDPRSKLFFEFVDILKFYKPKFFLLENVIMKKEWQDIISQHIGCEPVEINSALVSAQNRKRLYWTNIPIVGIPSDKNIRFSDISDDGKGFPAAMRGRRLGPAGCRSDYDLSIPITQYIECRKNEKTNCITTVAKDNVVTDRFYSRIEATKVKFRYLSQTENEKLQTLPVGYTKCVSANQAQKMIGNGWTVDVISHILSFM